MRGGLVAVGFHPLDFRLKQSDAFAQFILRIWRKILLRQKAGSVAPWAWAIVFVHHKTQHRNGLRLLSMGHTAIRTAVGRM